ncbi:KamA family radical SAM protein [bacterium]|nr:KamA family radical SAM protein [bacterium]
MNSIIHHNLSAQETSIRFAWQRFKRWEHVTPEQWNDWKWQYQNLVTTADEFLELFPQFKDEVEGIKSTMGKYKFTATPYYLNLIDGKNAECPIKLQSVPSPLEMNLEPGVDMRDPLAEDADMPVPGLVHRYPDRVLFLITEVCSLYCRYCTRRRVILEKESHIDRKIERAIEYIKNHPEIHDVIISGGDALVVGEKLLESVLSQLRAMPHIYTLRIGSRIPVVCPMRITPSLVSMLKKYQPLYFMTHFNHPYEITPEAKKACAMLVDNGIPIMNQAVLLRKINSCPDIMRELCYGLIQMRVKPYYLYQCDLSEGIGHFRTPVEKGLEIMKSLRGHISGLAIPTYVIDAPGGGGKIPILPDYVVGRTGKEITLKNYENQIFTYTEPAWTDCECSTSKEFTK